MVRKKRGFMHTFIKMAEVRRRTSLGRSTIYKKMAENGFPKPVSLGVNSVAWLEEDIIRWQEEKIQASRITTQLAGIGNN